MKKLVCVGKIKGGIKEFSYAPMFDTDLQDVKGGTKDVSKNIAKSNL